MNRTASFKAKLIRANGTATLVLPQNGTDFSLEELQGFVGGFIEIIRPPSNRGAILVVNEEGKLNGLPANELATEMWQQYADPRSLRMGDGVVGDVLLCHESQVK